MFLELRPNASSVYKDLIHQQSKLICSSFDFYFTKSKAIYFKKTKTQFSNQNLLYF